MKICVDKQRSSPFDFTAMHDLDREKAKSSTLKEPQCPPTRMPTTSKLVLASIHGLKSTRVSTAEEIRITKPSIPPQNPDRVRVRVQTTLQQRVERTIGDWGGAGVFTIVFRTFVMGRICEITMAAMALRKTSEFKWLKLEKVQQ